MQVGDLLAAVLALGVLGVLAHRQQPRAVQGVARHQVLEPVGLEELDQVLHARRLHLEHADRVAAPQHRVGGLVVQRHVVDVEIDVARPQVPERLLDHREVPKAEEVHLQQAELRDAVHVELRDHLLGVVPRVLRELQREVLDERPVADHDARGVHGVLAAQALQRAGGVDDLPGLGLALVGLAELRARLQGRVDRLVAPHDRRRIHLAELVAHPRREPEHARRVADPLLALDRLERDDLRDVVRAVLLGRVADHLVATALVEVHVDVGHLDPVRIQEPLEQQPVAQRIEVGDPQGVRHDRPRRRSPARADADPLLAREPDQVPHDQEVPREPHLRDDRQLVVGAFDHLGGQRIAVAVDRAALDQLAEVALERLAGRRLEPRQPVLGRALDQHPLELGQQLHTLGDREGGVTRLRELGEHAAHLGRALQVEVLGVELESFRIRLELLLLDAQQDVVRLRVLGPRVVEVVRRDHRHADLVRELDLVAQDRALIGEAVVLQLDEVPVGAEDVAVGRGRRARAIPLPRDELHPDLGGQAPGQAQQALGVLGQQLLVHPGAVIEALEVGLGDELEEVAVAGLVLGEQGQVVVLLLRLARCAVEPRSGGDVGLHADDRLDPDGPGRLVELERAEHRAVVGHRERRHVVGQRLGEHRGGGGVGLRRFDPCRAVQQRVFGVGMEVDEPLRHRVAPSPLMHLFHRTP